MIYVCSHTDLRSQDISHSIQRKGRHKNSQRARAWSYKKDRSEATKDATPQTMTVAFVRFEPVPPPEAPPGISEILKYEGSSREFFRGYED